MNPQPAAAPGDRLPPGPGLVITTESHLWDALEALLLDPFLRGELPVQHSAHVRRVPTELDVVAPGGRRTHLLRRSTGVEVVAEGVGWRAHYARFGEGDVTLTVVAVDERSAHDVVDALRALSLPPDPDDAGAILGRRRYGWP